MALPAARLPGGLRSRCRRWFAVAACAVLWLGSTANLSAQDRLLEHPARVRIAWGGGEATAWSGRIVLEGGSLEGIQLLSMEADAPGSIWLENPHTLRIESIRPHPFDGLDVTVAAPKNAASSARLVVELTSAPGSSPLKAEVPLSEALRKPFRTSLDARGNELVVHRSPGDALRIESEEDVLIFSPGEKFSFLLRPFVEEIEPSTSIDVEATLSPARGGETVWKDQQRLPVPVNGDVSTRLQVPLPEQQGVYIVHVKVGRPSGFRKRFLPGGAPDVLAERDFQVVVVDQMPPTSTEPGQWVQVLEIDPANPRWWQRLPDWTQVGRIPGVTPRPLGSLHAAAVDHPLGRFVELPPTVAGNEPHWQAYPLPVERTGVPHLLEVQYPAGQEQHIGLSIVEPGATGQAVPISRDSGVYVEGLGLAEHNELHTQRIVFWPRTNSPLLLVTNQHPSASARYGRIRVLRRKGSLAEPTGPKSWRDEERLAAAYLARPLLPEAFGASEKLDESIGQSADDWQTFFEGATRLADYLRYAGYNAAAVSVLADGSALFPNDRLLPTPLYDTGRRTDGASDLPPSDPLELTLRLFDAQGLALLPALELAAPLPELEQLRRAADPRLSGLEWVGPDGRTWLETYGTQRGLAPYYNLLDQRVQDSILDLVRDLIQRYGQHPALAGVAVQLSADGYAQLPDLEWGLDDATIAQFQRDTGVRVPGEGPNRFAVRRAALTGEHADAWRTWRAGRVTHFYRRLASLVQSTDSRRRLLLTTEDTLGSPLQRSELRPSVMNKLRVDRLMLEAGIDRQQLQETSGIELCPTRYIQPAVPLVDRAIDLEINDAFASAARRETGPGAAAMFYFPPRRTRLASFDAKSPFPAYTLLLTESAADGAAARQPLATSLAAQDPTLILQGGELLPMGQEDATRNVLQVLRQLPRDADVTVHRQQPITVRAYAQPHQTTYAIVNECPWTVDAEVMVDVPSETMMLPLRGASADPAGGLTARMFEPGRQVLSLRLAPYDVQAVRWAGAGVNVAELHAAVSEAGQQELQALLGELDRRNLTAPQLYSKLANPGFEPVGAGDALPGWQLVGPNSGATAELDATTPHDGRTCLYVGNRVGPATVHSDPLPTPPTGQLAMTLYVRGENLGPNTQLRLVFESDQPHNNYRRYATVSGDPRAAQHLDSQWRYYAFGVNDLPLDSQGRMQVKFELTGPGEIWVDEVQLFDLLFPLSFYENSEREKLELVKLKLAAESAYGNGRVADCVRLLESYWLRFMLAYTPLHTPVPGPAIVTQPPPAPPTDTPPDEESEETSPSIGERLKQYVPSILRF